MGKRIFAEDWRACQEWHLRAVVAAGDTRTQSTLVQVLQDIGFSEEKLAELGAGLAPTDAALQPQPAQDTEAETPEEPVPTEAAESVDEDAPPEPVAEEDEREQADQSPGQLSLFQAP